MKSNNFNTKYSVGADTPKKKSVPVIAGICALVLVGASALAYAFVPPVKNAVRLAVLKPEDYLEVVVQDNCESLAKIVSSKYNESVQSTNIQDGVAYDYDISVELKDDVISTIDDYFVENLGESLPDTFPTTYSINGNINSKDGLASFDMYILANDSNLLTANLISDIDNQKLYARVNELSDAYVYLSNQDDSDSYYGELYDNCMKPFEKFSLSDVSMVEDGITGKDLADTIVKYSNIFIENLDSESTIDKNVEGDVLSVEYKYNVISTTISEQQLIDISLKVLDEMESDEIIESILIDNGTFDSNEEYLQYIDDDKEFNNTQLSHADGMVTIKTYVNSYGIVCGFEMLDLVDDDNIISIMFALDDNSYGLDVQMEEYHLLQVHGNSSGNAISGKAILSDRYDCYIFDFEDVSITNDGYLNGKFSTEVDNEYFKTISIEAIAGDKSQSVNVDLNGKIAISSNVVLIDAVDVTLPSDNIFDLDTQYEEYLYQMDSETFLQNTLTTLGLKELYEKYILGSFYASY